MKDWYGIIRIIPSERGYCPKSDEWYLEEYDNYLDIHIPIGSSVIGGPIVDLPSDIEYPEGYYFMAQLNCSEIKPYDKAGLLPETGFLYFFVDDYGDDGIVFYTEKNENALKRIIKEHTHSHFCGKIVKAYKPETETWENHVGDAISKIYGIYSNCQALEEEIIDFMEDENNILLLQIGSDFLDAGCQNVFININDIKNKDFDKCVFEYNQT